MAIRRVVIDPLAQPLDVPHDDVGLDWMAGAAGRRRLERGAERTGAHPVLHARSKTQQRRGFVHGHRLRGVAPPRATGLQHGRELPFVPRRRQVDGRRAAVSLDRGGNARPRGLLAGNAPGFAGRDEADVARERMEEPGERVPGIEALHGARPGIPGTIRGLEQSSVDERGNQAPQRRSVLEVEIAAEYGNRRPAGTALKDGQDERVCGGNLAGRVVAHEERPVPPVGDEVRSDPDARRRTPPPARGRVRRLTTRSPRGGAPRAAG